MKEEDDHYLYGREERDPRKRKRMSEEGMEVERRSRSRERRRRESGEYHQPQDPRLQGKGDSSYNNGGSYRHQDEAVEASGGEEDKKVNQGER